MSWPLSQDLAEKITEIIRRLGQESVHSITIGYNGEPTLNENMGDLLEITRDELSKSGINHPRITVFTNSSTLDQRHFRKTFQSLDTLLAKLDAPDQDSINRVNRPHESVPRFETIVENLSSTRKMLEDLGKKLVLQTLLVSPFLRNDEATVKKFSAAFNKIRPHAVQLYSFSRRPAEPGIRPWKPDEIKHFRDRLLHHVKQDRGIYGVF
jgi:wyosine [tRNA(Phe)-imidazoG37] synthetase (radical SAM superfamily)